MLKMVSTLIDYFHLLLFLTLTGIATLKVQSHQVLVIILTSEHAILSHHSSWFVKPSYRFMDISLKALPFPSLILVKQFHFTVIRKRNRWEQ